MPHYIVKTSSDRQPSSHKWRHEVRRVAVLKVTSDITDESQVPMISTRANGVLQVVKTWERCRVGKTERSQYGRALAEARELAAELNGEAQ